MSYEAGGLGALVAKMSQVSDSLVESDARFDKRIDGIEHSVNELYRTAHRPGGFAPDDFTRKDSSIEFCKARRALTSPRIEGNVEADYRPSHDEISEARLATKALHDLFRHGDASRLSTECRKSLSAFSFGGNSFLLAPEMSSQIISCIVDPTDLAGLMNQTQISAGSVRFPIDNMRLDYANWACEGACWTNNPNPDLAAGMGELEIKVEPLRYVVCATRDLLADALFDVEAWILAKVADAFKRTLNASIVIGDGVGKPLGILHPLSGIPICDTSVATQPGQFAWQDLLLLKSEIPNEWQTGNGTYLMNQRTFALLCTMSDPNGRPLILSSMQGQPGMTLFGSPIQIVSQFPDVNPGATPIAFGDWKKTYMIVRRSGPTMTVDAISSFCNFFLFEQRIGAGTLCPNAARLLRIR